MKKQHNGSYEGDITGQSKKEHAANDKNRYKKKNFRKSTKRNENKSEAKEE